MYGNRTFSHVLRRSEQSSLPTHSTRSIFSAQYGIVLLLLFLIFCDFGAQWSNGTRYTMASCGLFWFNGAMDGKGVL